MQDNGEVCPYCNKKINVSDNIGIVSLNLDFIDNNRNIDVIELIDNIIICHNTCLINCMRSNRENIISIISQIDPTTPKHKIIQFLESHNYTDFSSHDEVIKNWFLKDK